MRHNKAVRAILETVTTQLYFRGLVHDRDKLIQPQKTGWDAKTPRPKIQYGTREYYDHLLELDKIVQRHYENASHHPEHFPQGIAGMSLLDLIEMLADWSDINKHHGDGNLMESIRIGVLRFKIDPQLAKILENTAVELELV